ncbi:MAG: hypothetical protein PWP57_367 [Candidatus Atribacteria bacterium]|nr:hypothetical protein [Candidatus Atribacteria bacterium]
MVDFEFSEHAENMREERGILLEWVRLTLEDPVKTEQKGDGTVHYIRPIEECGEKYLRVVVNPDTVPWRIVTLFFDRRLKRRLP